MSKCILIYVQIQHSTETDLLTLHNNITLNMDNVKVTALNLLDLTAVFNTINHVIPLNSFLLWYEVPGVDQSWIISCLRHQIITIDDCFSSPLNVSCGVPQGLVLELLLFTL